MPTAGNYPDLFDPRAVDEAIARINALTAESQPLWGRMSVGQMLAHCCVPYEMVYTDKHQAPNPVMRWVLKRLVKPKVVGPAPYARSTPTAPAFRITGARDFVAERDRLIACLRQALHDGPKFYEGFPSLSFGPLSAVEWNVLYSKHLDHHLTQFGV